MFPKHNPIDDLAKSVVSCDIRADRNASDAENVVLMTHLAKVLQVAFERALTRLETTTTTTSDYDFERFDDRKDAGLERERRIEREVGQTKERISEFVGGDERGGDRVLEADRDVGRGEKSTPDTPKMFQFAANEDDEDTEHRVRGTFF